mmetsp:Transcript_33379/g.72977  ORF Transcript_33379/g.72977 Transcript_33379/m.72977 type:complete len:209 (-) Transcript_33379:197-823(-)
MGRCRASTASKPSAAFGKRLQTRPLFDSMYLSKESPSRRPTRGIMFSMRKVVTLSLSPQPLSRVTGCSPLCKSSILGLPAEFTRNQAAFLLFALAASSNPCRSELAWRTTRGLSPAGAAGSVVSVTAGPVMDRTHSTIVSAVRPPSYSVSLPSSNHTIVGKPLTLYLEATSFSSVASTFPRRMPLSLRVVAAFSYSGSSFLQCPHHGA